jgi:[protein-PII] uridylyltransferase
MRHYFLTVREVVRLTRVVEPAILRSALGPPAVSPETDPGLRAAGFVLAEGKLLAAPGREFEREPIQMLRILQVARDRGLELHPLAIHSLTRNDRGAIKLRDDKAASELFMDLLCGGDAENVHADGARWLAVLNEAGFLGHYLPDWGRIVGQMQFDTYHVYTVDEHTIEAVGVLNQMERGKLAQIAPVASNLIDQVQSRRALYLAMMLHDIAKGRGGDHSQIGAELALTVGPALGLTPEETETVSWLVLHHLLLTEIAFKRDIDDPKIILDLADVIQSPERLRLLLVLTVADMRAVSAKVWNGWKATLLREVYHRAIELMSGGLVGDTRDVRVKAKAEAVRALLRDFTEAEFEAFAAKATANYWLSFEPQTLGRHARLMREASRNGAPLTLDTRVDPARAVTEVTLYTADHPGLFSRIAGALALAGANIVDAKILTLSDGMALDTFLVQDRSGGAFDRPEKLAKLAVLFENVLSGRVKPHLELNAPAAIGSRTHVFAVPPRVLINNTASRTHTVVEVNGRDRPGLLFELTRALTQLNLQIFSAKISTYGEKVVDVFYVKDLFGHKVVHEERIKAIRERLTAVLLEPAEASPPPRRRAKARTAAE